jgi:hypothetical protein
MNRHRFAGKHQKHRLECILRIVNVSQDALADVEHQRPMTVDERGESSFVSRGDETTEKGRVTFRFRRNHQSADILEQRFGTRGHDGSPFPLPAFPNQCGSSSILYYIASCTQNGTLIFENFWAGRA